MNADGARTDLRSRSTSTSASSYVSRPPPQTSSGSKANANGTSMNDTVRPWEQFLVRNHTPPYISVHAQVVHRSLEPVLRRGIISPPRSPVTSLSSRTRPSLSLMNYPPIPSPTENVSPISPVLPSSGNGYTNGEAEGKASPFSIPNHFIILCTDGLQDLFASTYTDSSSSSLGSDCSSSGSSPSTPSSANSGRHHAKPLVQRYVDAIVGGAKISPKQPPSSTLPRIEIPSSAESPFRPGENLALKLLRAGLAGEDNDEEMMEDFIAGPQNENGEEVDGAWLDDITVIVQTL